MIRPATIHDVPRIAEVINSHAELGKMLFKSHAELYEKLRDFSVYEDNNKVLGCVALSIIWADLAEVCALAVDEKYRGRGIGSDLVQWSIDEARRLQIAQPMTLTYEQAASLRKPIYCYRKGHTAAARDRLREGPKERHCDEIAMVRVLEDVAVVDAKAASPGVGGVSIPSLADDPADCIVASDALRSSSMLHENLSQAIQNIPIIAIRDFL